MPIYGDQLYREKLAAFLVRVWSWQDFDLDFGFILPRAELNLTFCVNVIDLWSRVELSGFV